MLARIAREFDRDYGHFTTRQNLQFNWPKLETVPDILALLATVQMHAIQTSGNCIRNVTADHLAGVAPDELEDPRPWCEYIRQWATLHPEFSYLPRKFKIAVTGSPQDRAASRVHDIGLHLVRNAAGEIGFEVIVGGGLGRTPIIGHVIREFLPKQELLAYLEAILRVYNLEGRRDNIHKARIKILVKAVGPQKFRELVEAEYAAARDTAPRRSTQPSSSASRILRLRRAYESLADEDVEAGKSREFRNWYRQNTRKHKVPGYRAVFAVAEGAGPAARRHHRGADGSRRRSRRSLFARVGAQHARPEPAVRGRAAARRVRSVAGAQAARAWQRRTSAR